MSYLPERHRRTWVAVGPDFLLDALAPLCDEHRRTGPTALVEGDARGIARLADDLAEQPATLLVLEDPSRPSARIFHSSPFLERRGQADVLLGWLRIESLELANYAKRACTLLRRSDEPEQALVLLASRERRYLELLDALEQAAAASGMPAFRWSAERIRRSAMAAALRLGAGAILYAGHGTARGWFAYGGIDATVFDDAWGNDETSALLFSLACGTGKPLDAPAGRDARGFRGFADHLVATGVAGAVLAPIGDPLHGDNRIVADALVRTLSRGERDLGTILDAVRSAGAPLDGYAVIGDPCLAALAAPGAVERAEAVAAPAPGAQLGLPLPGAARMPT